MQHTLFVQRKYFQDFKPAALNLQVPDYRISQDILREIHKPIKIPQVFFKPDDFDFRASFNINHFVLGNLEVRNLESKAIWQTLISKDEQGKVLQLLNSAETVGLLGATLRPVRTNTLKNFGKDFFLPTTVNQALRVKSLVKRVFAILGSLVLDTLTFPLRIITCIPAFLMHSKPQKHPFYQYLQEQNVEANVLDAEHVYVKLNFDGKKEEMILNFFKQPRYEGCDLGKRVVMNEFDLLRNIMCLRKG